MPLSSLTCPICLAVLKPSQPVQEGARVRCPKCKGAFTTEGEPRVDEPAQEPMPDVVEKPAADDSLETVEAAEPDEAPEPPQKKSLLRESVHKIDRPLRKKTQGRSIDEDEREDRPPRKRTKRGGIPLWVWLTAGGVGLVLLCGCCGIPSILLGTGNLSLPGSGSSTASGSGLFGLSFGSTVTMDNYKRIQRNMTEAQVIVILGQPTQNQTLFGLKVDVWQNGGDLITVYFDNAGRAVNREGRFTNGQITTVSSGF